MLLKDDLQKLISDNCILTLLCGRSSCGRQGQQLALKCLELKKKKKKASNINNSAVFVFSQHG